MTWKRLDLCYVGVVYLHYPKCFQQRLNPEKFVVLFKVTFHLVRSHVNGFSLSTYRLPGKTQKNVIQERSSPLRCATLPATVFPPHRINSSSPPRYINGRHIIPLALGEQRHPWSIVLPLDWLFIYYLKWVESHFIVKLSKTQHLPFALSRDVKSCHGQLLT